MADEHSSNRELEILESVADKPAVTKIFTYAKLSGPGWLQGAITLGGGSLAGALYLGVISGYGLMWLQPLAMICGIIMLSAIAYVTLSTGQRPFGSINRNLHPLLGWSWLVATIMANIVWTMPQFSLGTAAIQQNLFSDAVPQSLIIAVFLGIGLIVNYLYQTDGAGAKAFDLIIKIMVGVIVLSFMAVVVTLTVNGQVPWGQILSGFIPDPSLLFKPAASYGDLIAQSSNAGFWIKKISAEQQDVIMTAFGTAVGINMTWLLPYSLLKKRWGTKHRGLSIVDLSIGLFIPFFLATACVVISSASAFHTKTTDLRDAQGNYSESTLTAITKTTASLENVNSADQDLAAMLIKRDTNALAITLEPFAGPAISQKIFGIGVLGMAVSTIIILMLINGLAFQEIFTRSPDPSHFPPGRMPPYEPNKAMYFLGCGISGLAGACYPLFWTGEAKAALAVPTSVIGGSLLPIAYFTFLLLMNSKKVLGDKRPEGKARIIWNILMIFSTVVASAGSIWVLHGKTKSNDRIFDTIPVATVAWGGLIFLAILFIVGTLSFLKHEKESASSPQ
ncbi:MAG: divalent metal cation transporter [Verrucomicrobia bacterium]|nr:divalent metal cation transporter [Verrucomicrobiota bacterium]MDA1006687.1 divalent metal cation transporter [Verrucomicrobiota bacterium]